MRLEMDAAIQDVLSRGDLILRGDLERFEQSFAKYVGKKHCIGLNSGTDALYLSLWALGIGRGDEVITSSHTFVASAQVIAQLGAKPVLVDVQDDLLIHVDEIIDAITDKTRAIIPVHLTGDVAKMNFPTELKIVEDAAQAVGAKGVGYGITQCYSFYPAKILGAYGDAGAITTDDDNLAEELRNLRHHYKKDYSKWGINSRLDNMQAAILNVKMKHLDEAQIKRRLIADQYFYAFNENIPLGLPEYSNGRVWQDYIVRTEKRDALYEHLKSCGVETMKNEYPMPIPKLPNSIKIENETLRLPCNENLSASEIRHVIESVKSFF